MKALLWIVIVLNSGLYICSSAKDPGVVKDPDLWWHIVIGRWIISQRSVPVTDHWTMFGSGMPWRAYSWSIEVLFAAVDRWWGDHGLMVLQCLFAVALAAVLCWGLSRIARDYFFGGLLGVYTTAAMFSHFTLRPQVLVWVYFMLLLVTADAAEREGLKRRHLWTFFALMVLWANTHLSAILGLLAVGAWLFGRLPGRQVAAALACGFAGTLVTPYLGGEWAMFFQTATHPFSFHSVYEFQPATIAQYVTAFLVIALAVLAVFWHQRPQQFDPAKLLLTGVFVIGALAVVKFMPFALIVSAAVIACYWGRARLGGAAAGSLAEGFERLRALFRKVAGAGLVFLLGCTAVVQARTAWAAPINRRLVPVAAVDFILKRNLPHPILNPFGSGGYLMYRLSDRAGAIEHKVAIDGRTNLISKQLWANFYTALNGRTGWQAFINQVQPNTILWKWESPLTSILLEGGKWCLVGSSGTAADGFVVFLKREYFLSHQQEYPALRCG